MALSVEGRCVAVGVEGRCVSVGVREGAWQKGAWH